MKRLLLLIVVVASEAAVLIAGSAYGGSRGPSWRALTVLTCADETPPGVTPRFVAGSAARNFGPLALDSVGLWASKQPSGVHVVYRGRRYRLLKAFAYVLSRKASRVTLTVVSPATVGLYYASGSVWSSNPSSAQIVRAAARRVRFSACAGPTGYTGGLLIEKPGCVTLRVSENGCKPRTARLPIAPVRCNP